MAHEDILKKHWYELFNELKERWPDMTQADVYYISGDLKRLIEVVQQRRHISRDAARDDVDDFFARLQIHQRAL
jgi:uncharacterized protein YjbJ (UPF0337 family)